MAQFNFLTVSVKNLKRKTFRTGVLIASISLLVSLLIFAISFSISVTSSLKKSSQRLGADLIIVPSGAKGYAEDFLLSSQNTSFYMSKEMLSKVKEIEGIKTVTFQTYLESIEGVCCDVAQTQIIAFDQDTDFIVKPWLERTLKRPLQKGEAIAGSETSENLGLELLNVERTLFNNRFKIVGILEKTGTGLDNALFMTEESLKDIIESGSSPLKKEQISIIFAKIDEELDPYRTSLILEGTIIDVDVVARKDMGKKLLNILKDINKIFLISILLVSILTVFLVWAIFSAIANERSKEIGIMRAVGAKESQIVKLFILEVFVLGVMGSLVGIIAGTYISLLLVKGFTLLKNISASLTIIQHTGIALTGLVLGTLICITGALVPINRIKKLEPLSAIKEE